MVIYQTNWGATEDDIPEEVRDSRIICHGDIIIDVHGNEYSVSTSRTFEVDGSGN